MRRTVCAVAAAVVVLACASGPSAQGVTLATDLLKDWRAQKDTMLKLADAMPADKFDYRTTPPQRTYREQILHVAGANIMLLTFLGGKTTSPPINRSDLKVFGLTATAKPDVLKALSDSYDYGEAVLKEFSDAQLVQTITGPPWIGEATRARMVYFTLGHMQDIYGQMVVYLRLNGLVPPASRRGGV